jgi:predicted CXXCH cytochrome family protein
VPHCAHVRVPLQGGHAKVACVACHAEGSPRAVEVLAAAPGTPARGCTDCHADPHAGPQPKSLRFADTADCTRCHAISTWRAARPTDEQHADLGVPLRGPHAGEHCAQCHGDAARPVRWGDGAVPSLASCLRCHASPHGASFVAAAVAAQGPADGCANCHVDADPAWTAGRVTAEQHRLAGMDLVAPHAEVACAGCHRGAARSERFPGRDASDCRGCHQDTHRGQFANLPHGGQCSACHPAAHWAPSSFGTAAHAATAFPLAGAHAAVACRACHRVGADGTRQFHGLGTACRDCHQDVHRGVFDRAGRPQQIDGRRDCARCHDVAAFAPVAQTFVHATWTGYELVGAHAALACTQCHPRQAGEAIGRVAGTTCSSCHRDVHQAQFGPPGTVDCRRCHGATAWTDVHVAHDRTRFPLDATHAAVPCSRCHVSYPSEAGPVVRYVPLGAKCGDCHRLGAEARR